ncbi:four-helix bundle copper-binding protein [Mycobacterium nebraskense]|nr:four-helix bundle copper-binding protein [Mycobacterium nebraskense]KKC02957.1 hypothetical protein WU83_21525 [Mycobacterium nebraskense]KLO33308.1 hypothetical protein ABW17_28335 [Mycobacterium nebraskense]MCV7116709.1 four-helix bundle copper-binding protein [Mycobacterium nebraskense]
MSTISVTVSGVTCEHRASAEPEEPEKFGGATDFDLELGICQTCTTLLARGSAWAAKLCLLCAEICDACAAECGKFDTEHCRACAKACRVCAEQCRAMA